MRQLLLSILFVISSTQVFSDVKYLPENRMYGSQDTGYEQYQTPELWGQNKFVLTFDDGPHITRTPIILDTLKEYNIKATFFIVGQRITKSTLPIIKRMVDEGHIVANHSWAHDKLTTVTKEQFRTDVTKTFKRIKWAFDELGLKYDQFYFRFPYAAYGEQHGYHHINIIREVSQKLFGKNCIHFTFWDIDSGDWIPNMSPQEVVQNIRANIEGGQYTDYKVVNGKILKVKTKITDPKAGGTILFHDIQDRTTKAIPLLLKYFHSINAKVVALSETDVNSGEDFKGCKLNSSN